MSFPLNASEATVALGRPDLSSGHVRDDVGHEEATVTELDLARAAVPAGGYGWDDIDDFGLGVDPAVNDDGFDAGPLPWQEQALCAQTDPEAFFPEKGGSTREAKRVCSRCEVRGDCLSYALAHDERFGIWGGLSERERRRLKRRAG